MFWKRKPKWSDDAQNAKIAITAAVERYQAEANNKAWQDEYGRHLLRVYHLLLIKADGSAVPYEASAMGEAAMRRIIEASPDEIVTWSNEGLRKHKSEPFGSGGETVWRFFNLTLQGEMWWRAATTDQRRSEAKAVFLASSVMLFSPGV